jgi:hypothetical protein
MSHNLKPVAFKGPNMGGNFRSPAAGARRPTSLGAHMSRSGPLQGGERTKNPILTRSRRYSTFLSVVRACPAQMVRCR